MRTTSSFRFVGVFAPPRNCPIPLAGATVGAGKIPALISAVAFPSTMLEGIMLPGNGLPCTMPAGSPPGPGPLQFLPRTDAATCDADGTTIGVDNELKLPP